MVVYRRTNTQNGKVYIGKTIQSLSHRTANELHEANRGSDRAICRAIRKYGAPAFKTEVIYRAATLRELNAMETFFIILHQSHRPKNGYNLTLGGEANAGFKHSPEAKAKISFAVKGIRRSAETREKIRLANFGQKRPDWVCCLIGDSQRGRKQSHSTIKKRAATLRGRKRPTDVVAKISASQKGRTFTAAHRKKLSEARKTYLIQKNGTC